MLHLPPTPPTSLVLTKYLLYISLIKFSTYRASLSSHWRQAHLREVGQYRLAPGWLMLPCMQTHQLNLQQHNIPGMCVCYFRDDRPPLEPAKHS